MDNLIKDMKATRESFTRDNSALDESLKIIKVQQEKNFKEPQKPLIPKDLSEALIGHRLRCDIERAFYFHVTYKLLQSKFPKELDTTLTNTEKSVFERLGSQVKMPTSSILTLTDDLREVTEARKKFNSLPDRDLIIKERQDTTVLLKNDANPTATKRPAARRAKSVEIPGNDGGRNNPEEDQMIMLEEEEDEELEEDQEMQPATVGKYFS